MHALLALLGDEGEQEPALRLSAGLPVGRADALRGALLLSTTTTSDDQKREGRRLLRKGYAESAEDPEIDNVIALAGSYCTQLGDELHGMADRVYRRSPAESVALLRRALICEAAMRRAGGRSTSGRGSRPRPRAEDDLPHRKMAGVEAGRSALDSVRRVDGAVSQGASLTVLDPVAARAEAEQALGDPRPDVAMWGAHLIAAADLMAGRVADAESEDIVAAQRFHEAGDDASASTCVWREIRVRRWLGHPIPATERTAWLATFARDWGRTSPILAAPYLAEHALLRTGGRPSKAAAEAALGAMERLLAKDDQGNPHVRQDALAVTLPLVRVARGDAAAAQCWRETGKSHQRELVAFEAGLALSRPSGIRPRPSARTCLPRTSTTRTSRPSRWSPPACAAPRSAAPRSPTKPARSTPSSTGCGPTPTPGCGNRCGS